MTVFEFLLALYAIVAGLGVSLLVTSVGQMIEARDRVRLYWVHSCWLALTFVGHVVSWFTIWRFHDHAPWTVLQALLLLCVPILLYLISHLAVPDLEDDRLHDMRDYYFRHARWTQGLLLGVVIAGALSHLVIENKLDLVRCARRPHSDRPDPAAGHRQPQSAPARCPGRAAVRRDRDRRLVRFTADRLSPLAAQTGFAPEPRPPRSSYSCVPRW
jgi:hypothetical protein